MTAFLVLLLIAQLGDDRFDRRQAAEAAIARRLPAGLVLVERAATRSEDAEIRSRCRRLVRLDDRRWLAMLTYPWIDCLPENFPDRPRLIGDYLDRACREVPRGGWADGFPDYRKATELLIADLRAEGTPRRDLEQLLEAMAAGEKRMRQAHERQAGP